MREIKFRAYNKHTKKMYEVEGLSFRHNNIIVVSDIEAERRQKLGDFELMQYTGLKDKNGKEIYEGDILRITYTSHETLIKVIFKEGTFVGLKTKSNCNCVALLSKYDLKNFEIIGNIYENIFLNDKFEQDTNKIIFD